MKKIIKYFLVFAVMFVVYSCTKDFIVKDIKNDVVNIIAPADNLNTPSNAITFWWDELDGAEKYNLQIVKPSFNSVLQLLVDTNISINKFNYTFTPGTYQWRVRAMNSGGNTIYSTRTIIIDTTSNLSLVTVSPIAPLTNYITGNKTINFSWNALNAASYYEIEVKDASGGIVLNQSNIANTTYSYTFSNTSDVVYSWRVKAHNSFSFSQYNTANTFSIDITAPSVSQFTAPGYGNTVNDSVYLKWNRYTGTKYDSIIVSYDSLGTSYINSKRVNGLNTQISGFSLITPGPSVGYYWARIISIDSVKNKSQSSNRLKFKLN